MVFEGFILDYYKKLPFFRKPFGILTFWFILTLFAAAGSCSKEGFISTKFYLLFLIASIIVMIHASICLKSILFPKAKRNKLGVLFVVNCENTKVFIEIQNKLIKQFSLMAATFPLNNIEAICIMREKIPKYSIYNESKIIELLERTNCIFVIDMNYDIDNVDSAYNFEMEINTAVRHPRYNEDFDRQFTEELTLLTKPVRKKKFCKDDKIETIKSTISTLHYTCTYIIAIVLMTVKDFEEGYELLRSIYKNINIEQTNDTVAALKDLLPKRLWDNCMLRYIELYDKYVKTNDRSILQRMFDLLEESNSYVSNTYSYNLNMAYTCFALNRDVGKAVTCIAACKSLNAGSAWQLSDAFLYSYQFRDPLIIYNKYKKALTTDYPDLLSITEYINIVLLEEPKKVMLNFALALIYHKLGDDILMMQHLALFEKSLTRSHDYRDIHKIISRLKSSVGCKTSDCTTNCLECPQII